MSRPRPITATTADGWTVQITTSTVGQSFGTIGQVRTSDGKYLLAVTSPPRPYGFEASALEDARQLAATLTISPRPTR